MYVLTVLNVKKKSLVHLASVRLKVLCVKRIGGASRQCKILASLKGSCIRREYSQLCSSCLCRSPDRLAAY